MSAKNVLLGGSLILVIILMGGLIVTATFMLYGGSTDESVTGLATAPTITEAQASSIASSAVKGAVEEIKMGKENGLLLYSVEIENEKGEHDIKIDAYTGEIVKIEVEEDVGEKELKAVKPKISEEQAKKIALSAFSGRVTDFEAKKLNGQYAYEVEITNENVEADVLVDMMDGKVIGIEQDAKEDDDNDEDDLSQEEPTNSQTKITQEQAIKIALNKVNGEVTDVEIEKKFGRTAYVVEIDADGEETDVIIDIETGNVLGIEN